MTLSWEAQAIAGVVLIAAGFGMAYGLFGKEAWVSYRMIARYCLTIAFPLAVVVGVTLWALSLVASFPVPIWQALIAGVSLATGWLTTSIFAELARRQNKEEKTRDYHKALYAEIRDTLAALSAEGQSYAGDMVTKMQNNSDFVPFIPKETHDRVYAALIGEIEALPRQTIDAIVTFYSLIRSIAALAEDMRGEAFKTMDQSRRIVMYQDYFSMRMRAYHYGQYALKLVSAYSEKGPQAAESLAQELNKTAINIPDVVPNARQDLETE